MSTLKLSRMKYAAMVDASDAVRWFAAVFGIKAASVLVLLYGASRVSLLDPAQWKPITKAANGATLLARVSITGRGHREKVSR
jgi:hypothetical protein